VAVETFLQLFQCCAFIILSECACVLVALEAMFYDVLYCTHAIEREGGVYIIFFRPILTPPMGREEKRMTGKQQIEDKDKHRK